MGLVSVWLSIGCVKGGVQSFVSRVTEQNIKDPTHLEAFAHRSLHRHHIPKLQRLNQYYLDIAQKYDRTQKGEITGLEYFVVRSTFHHMTAVGDLLFPEASLIVKKLLYADRPKPTRPNRNIYNCRSYRTPLKKLKSK